MGRLLGRCLKSVRVPSGVASAPMAVPAAVVMTDGHPASNNLAREALIRWVDGTSSSSYGG
jgi:hypothetical protein